jgi:hypothetical protein
VKYLCDSDMTSPGTSSNNQYSDNTLRDEGHHDQSYHAAVGEWKSLMGFMHTFFYEADVLRPREWMTGYKSRVQTVLHGMPHAYSVMESAS